ncbi:hypothetical protein TSAR_006895 [Trichomalopsis sarcophagae]|uniref:Uncharacterized protein n=1 Tax=Trichomalopsis sarcophagae TaxID=543379 RepID=A0A232EDJ6_9HYME|nr:hypothetical protein TSAR_006895 [Trichomalopsis sarcophagae]
MLLRIIRFYYTELAEEAAEYHTQFVRTTAGLPTFCKEFQAGWSPFHTINQSNNTAVPHMSPKGLRESLLR